MISSGRDDVIGRATATGGDHDRGSMAREGTEIEMSNVLLVTGIGTDTDITALGRAPVKDDDLVVEKTGEHILEKSKNETVTGDLHATGADLPTSADLDEIEEHIHSFME